MADTHLATPLAPGRKSQAYWARQPARKLVLFVHGWNGTAVESWGGFSSMLPNQPENYPKFMGVDLLFYGYDGLNLRVATSAFALRGLMERLMSAPRELIQQSAPSLPQRDDGFEYDRLVVVAHSFGAIVSRQALLDAHRLGHTWPSRTRLVLFAPAHKGATISRFASAALTAPANIAATMGQALERLMARKMNVMKNSHLAALDLEKDCATLRVLERQTQIELAQGNADHLIAQEVIFGDLEDIVEPVPFANDPPPRIFPGLNHVEVCKPNPAFCGPIESVAAAL